MVWYSRVLRYAITTPITRRVLSTTTAKSELSHNVRRLTVDDLNELFIKYVGRNQRFGEDTGHKKGADVSQEELPVRHTRDSVMQCIVRIASDPQDRKLMLAHNGGVRVGKIMSTMDLISALIAYGHDYNPALGDGVSSPFAYMTLLIDRIDVIRQHGQLTSEKDIFIDANVTWTGQSSIEATIDVEQEVNDRMEKFITGRFLMVAVEPTSRKTGVVNRLEPETREERTLFSQAEERRLKRSVEKKMSLLKVPPTSQETKTIHSKLLATISESVGSFTEHQLPENSVWMADTRMTSAVTYHHEEANLYRIIFGGSILDRALDFATTTASFFSRQKDVMCLSINDMLFLRPVWPGDTLFFTSQVVYTEGSELVVHIRAEVKDAAMGTSQRTHDMHITFDTGSPNLPSVVPKSYGEAMDHLTGMRHYKS